MRSLSPAAAREENGLLEQMDAYRGLRRALAKDSRPAIMLLPALGQFYGGDAPQEAFYEQVEVGDCIPVRVRSGKATA